MSDARGPNDHNGAGSGLFEPGLIVDRSFGDLPEMAAGAPYWNLEYFKIARGKSGGAFRAGHSVGMQIGRFSWRSALLAQGDGPRRTFVLAAHAGGTSPVHRGQKIGNTNIAVMTDESGIEIFSKAASDLLVVALDQAVIRRQGRAFFGDDRFVAPESDLVIECTAGQHRAIVAQWTRLLEFAATQPKLLADPIVARQVEDAAGSIVMACIRGPAKIPPPRVRRSAAIRAMEYIRAEPGQFTTLAALCEAIGASLRTVETGFRELFGVSPKTYITLLRLNRARRDLSAGDRYATVTDIATRWGFYHFGRFADAYRAAFGELPSTTLQKSVPSYPRDLIDMRTGQSGQEAIAPYGRQTSFSARTAGNGGQARALPKAAVGPRYNRSANARPLTSTPT